MSKAKTRAPKFAPAPALPPMDESIPEVNADDEVAIKPCAFRPDGAKMTPIELFKIGWPNRFRVLDVQEVKGVRYLKLDPCCEWMEDHDNGSPRCVLHPAIWFSKLNPPEETEESPAADKVAQRVPAENDRYSSVDTPWGEVLGVEYLDDDKVPAIKLRFAGGRKPFAFTGEVARFLRDRAVELGFL